MEGTANPNPTPEPHRALACADAGQSSPFSRQWVAISKREHIDLVCRASYWEAQLARVKSQLEEARQDNLLKLEALYCKWKARIGTLYHLNRLRLELQTQVLWGINPRHWLTRYLTACAENGASAPQDIDPFLPWSMDESRRAALGRLDSSQALPAEPVPIDDSS